MTTATYSALAIFGEVGGHHGLCCECCEGYCSRAENTPTPENLIEIGGYLSDRYVAITPARIDPATLGDVKAIPKRVPLDDMWQIPSVRPAESGRIFTPSKAGRLLRLGLHIGHADTGQQPIYDGDVHIGWIMAANEGSTLGMIRRSIALVDDPKIDVELSSILQAVPFEPLDALAMIRRAATLIPVTS